MTKGTAMNKAENFLRKYGLHEDCFNFEEHVRGFTAEMEAGLSGRESSLLMLPSYLGVEPETPPSGEVIAVDAGGTNIRIALVSFKPGEEPVVNRLEKHRLPGSDGEITKDEFFGRIAAYIGERTDASGDAGFCFSFPSEIGADRDGKIIHFDKEVKVKDSAGRYIGKELNDAFIAVGKAPLNVTVLNDTAAALIGGVVSQGVSGMGGYIGMIYGTGFNVCYYDPVKKMLINTEAGGYSGITPSVCDAEIDAESDDPGKQRLEKMVSGAYFSSVALKAIRLAAREGLFRTGTAELIGGLAGLDAVTIDAFMREDGGRGTSPGVLFSEPEDAALLYGIFDGLYERAAKLLAIAITAVLARSGASAAHKGYIVAEGSAFRYGFRFRERFERYIMANARGDRPYELKLADDHVLIGAGASVFL